MIPGSCGSSTLPELADGQNDKVASGSKLIAINHDAKQGRFLQVCIAAHTDSFRVVFL